VVRGAAGGGTLCVPFRRAFALVPLGTRHGRASKDKCGDECVPHAETLGEAWDEGMRQGAWRPNSDQGAWARGETRPCASWPRPRSAARSGASRTSKGTVPSGRRLLVCCVGNGPTFLISRANHLGVARRFKKKRKKNKPYSLGFRIYFNRPFKFKDMARIKKGFAAVGHDAVNPLENKPYPTPNEIVLNPNTKSSATKDERARRPAALRWR